MATVKLAPNLAAQIEVKWLDIVPGQYGPQLRIKGMIDGEDAVLYLPGKLADVLHSMIQGGVIANADYDMEPEKAVAVTALKCTFAIVNKVAAGEKYGTLEVVGTAKPNGASQSTHAGPGLDSDEGYNQARPQVQAGSISRQMESMYLDCLKFCNDNVRQVVKDATATDVIAATATLYIARTRAT